MEGNPSMEKKSSQFSDVPGKETDVHNFDYKALGSNIQSESFWVFQLDSTGFVDIHGKAVDHSKVRVTPGVRPVYVLYCYERNGPVRFSQECTGLPETATILQAIKRAIVNPKPPLKPCLPWLLVLSVVLSQHADALKPFLNSLPAPFHWRVECRDEAEMANEVKTTGNPYQKSIAASMVLAENAKFSGNEAFSRKDIEIALNEYTAALRHLANVLAQSPTPNEEEKARKLRAVCYANRSATYMLPGPGANVENALDDGKAAENADQGYAKAYLRQVSGYLLLQKKEAARTVLVRALVRKDLDNHSGLVDRLIELLTDGRGFSNDGAVFKQWITDVMIHDKLTGGVAWQSQGRVGKEV